MVPGIKRGNLSLGRSSHYGWAGMSERGTAWEVVFPCRSRVGEGKEVDCVHRPAQFRLRMMVSGHVRFAPSGLNGNT